MRIIFNTRYKNAPSSVFYKEALSLLEKTDFYDWDNYKQFDIALFMAFDKDLEDLKRAKINFPSLVVGLVDPRGSSVEPFIKYVDFFIVYSIEAEDFFAKYNLPIFVYCVYPNIAKFEKKHNNKELIIIGYHGNKVHLSSMYPNVTKALELLGEKYSIEFWAMYNIEKLGMCNFGIPSNIKTKHIQWSEENYIKYLAKADIGIVPNLMPIKGLSKMKKKAIVCRKYFNGSIDDYLVRFKMLSNPGRIIIFGKLGIPVVADFYPSALQLIDHEYNGMVAYSMGGWYKSMEKLIVDTDLRMRIARNMRKKIDERFDFRHQNIRLIEFFENLLHNGNELKKDRTIIGDENYINSFWLKVDRYKQKLNRIKKYYLN